MKKIKFSIILVLLFITTIGVFSQTGSIQGKITDSSTSEELTGATVLVQGTNSGVITDFEGNYKLTDLKSGSYNIVFNFISYQQQIVKCEVKPREIITLDIALLPAAVSLEEVVVKKTRNTNTEISMISEIKAKEGIVSGISAEQIAKTQDKDAAEVIRRVPGITITDGKFVVVRGLNQRYNSILLNGVSAPSFESDIKAFSLDALPSNMIENILIYKSPAPEIPADFAGAVINIITKQNADKNELKLSYSLGYKENTTYNSDFQTYEGGKLGFLGFDDGARELPKSVPSTDEYRELFAWKDLDDYKTKMNQLVDISHDFNSNWATQTSSPLPDQSFTASLQRRFTLGNTSFGNITSLNYKLENSYLKIRKPEYENYDEENDILTYDYDYTDLKSTNSANIGLIHNWIMIFGKNQKLELRNLFNNMGESVVSQRSGDYTYNSETARITNLRFKQRTIYSGQLAGKHGFANGSTYIDWVTGYSTTRNNEPDNRIVKYAREIGTDNPFVFKVDKEVNVFNGGRRYQLMNENSLSSSVNLVSSLFRNTLERAITLKAGFYHEYKHRNFNSKLYGIVAPRGTQALDVDLTLPVDELLTSENFFYDQTNINRTGFVYKDGSNASNSYQIKNNLVAGYFGIKLPITQYFEIYGGLRAEKLNRLIYDTYENQSSSDSVDIRTDTLNIYPSVNIAIKFTEKHVIRISYGKTVNHPEFRELSPVSYYDFDLNAIVHGNPGLKDSYINNFDARYEWYPNTGEMVSVAAFYKFFESPIETFLIPAGTGQDYKPYNVLEAYCNGIEVDIRKRFLFFEDVQGPLHFLKDFTVVANASLIQSEMTTDTTEIKFYRELTREMQGQSPYIVNLGVYYDNQKSGTKVNVSFNKIGRRIIYAGSPTNPHTWELPRNSLDINLAQALGKRFEVTFGVKDLLNNSVRYIQKYKLDESLELPTYEYLPNRKFSVGISATF